MDIEFVVHVNRKPGKGECMKGKNQIKRWRSVEAQTVRNAAIAFTEEDRSIMEAIRELAREMKTSKKDFQRLKSKFIYELNKYRKGVEDSDDDETETFSVKGLQEDNDDLTTSVRKLKRKQATLLDNPLYTKEQARQITARCVLNCTDAELEAIMKVLVP